tara:strand:+ start:3112 stop:3756 length:645 start_codon:yes stop_codon:yes gene_type:complete
MPLPSVFRTKDKKEREEKTFSRHLSYRDCLHHIGSLDISTFFKFALVRNPWCRIASYYFSKQEGHSVTMKNHIPHMKKQFSSWIKEAKEKDEYWYMEKPKKTCPDPSPEKAAAILDAGKYPILHCQQIQYLTEDMSTEGRIAVDFVGRFESLRKDLDHIEQQIGIKINLPKRKLGKAKGKKHYSLYYNEESIEMIRDLFAKDIEYFGYEFEDRT